MHILILFLVLIGVCTIFMATLALIWRVSRFRPFKKLCHDVLGWHEPDYSEYVVFDGCGFSSICKICGKYIAPDSQGNWF